MDLTADLTFSEYGKTEKRLSQMEASVHFIGFKMNVYLKPDKRSSEVQNYECLTKGYTMLYGKSQIEFILLSNIG